jgi:hypothetical protein
MLSEGLLWFQAGCPLEERIQDAILRYREKYGQEPEACLVSSKEVQDPIMVEGCKVIPDDAVLENHVWVGVV